MENKSTMKSRFSWGSETTSHVDVEKFLISKKGVRPTYIKNKTSYNKDAVEGIEISYSGESCYLHVDTKFPFVNQSTSSE
jgi:hypothetical protein